MDLWAQLRETKTDLVFTLWTCGLIQSAVVVLFLPFGRETDRFNCNGECYNDNQMNLKRMFLEHTSYDIVMLYCCFPPSLGGKTTLSYYSIKTCL